MRRMVDRIGQGGGSGRDILAEERVRRFRWWWPFDWAPGRVLTGRFGLVMLVGFLVVGAVWVMFWNGGPDESGYGRRQVGAGGVGERRALGPLDTVRAAEFGEVLYVGENGLPVVEHSVTGVVRELTPVEWEHDAGIPFVVQDYGSGVVWAPGPRGWGMWWSLDDEVESLRTKVKFPRDRWIKKQEVELRWTAWRVSETMEVLLELDLEGLEQG